MQEEPSSKIGQQIDVSQHVLQFLACSLKTVQGAACHCVNQDGMVLIQLEDVFRHVLHRFSQIQLLLSVR